MLTRRSFFAFSAAASLARHAHAASPPLFKPVEINHIALRAVDLEASENYYRDVFGAPGIIFEKPGQRYMRMGKNFVALFERDEPAMDHFAISIEDYDADAVESQLKALGHETRRSSDFVYVHDPDGIEIQIAHAEHEMASPVVREAPEKSIFKGSGVRHVAVRVGKLERSVNFYQSLFGLQQSREAANGAWLSVGPNELGLFAGADPGLDHYSLAVESYDARTAGKAMRAVGHPYNRNYGLFFAWDPNRHRIEVAGPDAKHRLE